MGRSYRREWARVQEGVGRGSITRITVGTIVGLVASGHSAADIVKLYPSLMCRRRWLMLRDKVEEVELPLAP